jgi:hypothetical protein
MTHLPTEWMTQTAILQLSTHDLVSLGVATQESLHWLGALYNVLVGKLLRKRPHGRPRRWEEDNTQMLGIKIMTMRGGWNWLRITSGVRFWYQRVTCRWIMWDEAYTLHMRENIISCQMHNYSYNFLSNFRLFYFYFFNFWVYWSEWEQLGQEYDSLRAGQKGFDSLWGQECVLHMPARLMGPTNQPTHLIYSVVCLMALSVT